MRAWAWFTVVPATLAAAYMAAPALEGRFAAQSGAVTAVTPIRLPQDAGKPAPKTKELDNHKIQLSAFGITVPKEVKRSPAVKARQPAPHVFALQSILMGGGNASAVIDDKLVHRGDKLSGGYRVERIESQVVWLAGPKGSEALRFPEYRDPVPAPAPATKFGLQAPAAPEQKANRAEVEKNYRQILQMLKL